MIDLKRAHDAAQSSVGLFIVFVAALVLLVGLSVFTSPNVVILSLIGIIFVLIAAIRPLWGLAFIAFYLPFEPFLLKWFTDDIYIYARFFSEGFIYLLFAIAIIHYFVLKERPFPKTPINTPILIFASVAILSAIVNTVDPVIAGVGLRQLFRWILVFFIVILLEPSKKYIIGITLGMLGITFFESGLGIMQRVFGESLDAFLLPSQVRTFGEFTITEGTLQFWNPGERVFGTLGRYDRLGVFLASFLLIAAAFLYEKVKGIRNWWLWAVLAAGIPSLIFTFSRSSWFGLLLGFLIVALFLKKDRIVKWGVIASSVVIALYLTLSGLTVGRLIDVPEQTIPERFFEAFSYERWVGEYYGLGRLFWIVHTVTDVVPASPIFGFGPGTYGGGAAIIFNNTEVYDRLGLPYGVYGTEGYIDNNWLSIWGETGTLGFIAYVWMYVAMMAYAVRAWKSERDKLTRAIALGVVAMFFAGALNAFLATFFEVRTLSVYLWMFAGFLVVLMEDK